MPTPANSVDSQSTRDQPTPVPSATDGLAVLLTVLASFITLLASIPAWRSYQLTPTGPGPREDANFYNLLASAVLQVLGLAVQMFGPLGWPSLFRRAAVATGDTAVVVWVFVALTLICTIASIPIFLWLSAQWSGMIAFAGQSILGLVQLLLVFG